jgi:lysophospholipase L1-like esterase
METNKDSLNKEAVDLLETFVNKIRQRGCKLVFVVSPNYGRNSDLSLAVKYLREKSKKDKIPLYVYSGDTSFITHPDYFADPDHLNVTGAQIFTRDLVHKIKSELIQHDHISINSKLKSY